MGGGRLKSRNTIRIKMKEKNKNRVKEYFDFKDVVGYFFRKNKGRKKPDFNLRVMHGINKISIIMFLIAVAIIIIRNIIW
jgi:hypothetical protein